MELGDAEKAGRDTPAGETERELTALGIPCDVISGPVFWNNGSVTRGRVIQEATTAAGRHVFIDENTCLLYTSSWKNYISSNYKKYGFSSSTDLANQFTLWQTNGGSAPSLNFDQDEGIWTFNGAKYSDPDDLEQAFKNAGLTEGQKAVLRKKMALFGYQRDVYKRQSVHVGLSSQHL